MKLIIFIVIISLLISINESFETSFDENPSLQQLITNLFPKIRYGIKEFIRVVKNLKSDDSDFYKYGTPYIDWLYFPFTQSCRLLSNTIRSFMVLKPESEFEENPFNPYGEPGYPLGDFGRTLPCEGAGHVIRYVQLLLGGSGTTDTRVFPDPVTTRTRAQLYLFNVEGQNVTLYYNTPDEQLRVKLHEIGFNPRLKTYVITHGYGDPYDKNGNGWLNVSKQAFMVSPGLSPSANGFIQKIFIVRPNEEISQIDTIHLVKK